MFRVTVTHGNQDYSVPHVSDVPFKLAEGKEIVIKGVTSHDAKGFLVSLSVGRDHNSETPFVFNPRFNQNEVVRNHNSNGWGSEEKHGGFPFSKGSPYEIKIVVRTDCYKVFVNNNYFCDFKHRLPMESVRHLCIEGATSISSICFSDVCPADAEPLIASADAKPLACPADAEPLIVAADAKTLACGVPMCFRCGCSPCRCGGGCMCNMCGCNPCRCGGGFSICNMCRCNPCRCGGVPMCNMCRCNPCRCGGVPMCNMCRCNPCRCGGGFSFCYMCGCIPCQCCNPCG